MASTVFGVLLVVFVMMMLLTSVRGEGPKELCGGNACSMENDQCCAGHECVQQCVKSCEYQSTTKCMAKSGDVSSENEFEWLMQQLQDEW